MKAIVVHVADADAPDARLLVELALAGNAPRRDRAITVWSLEVEDVRPPEPAPQLPTAGVAGRAATSRAAATTVDATSQAGVLLAIVVQRLGHGVTVAEATTLMRHDWPSISRNQVATRMGQLHSSRLVARRNARTNMLDVDGTASSYVTRPTDDRGNRGAVWYSLPAGQRLNRQGSTP